jgi:hypothetical protein
MPIGDAQRTWFPEMVEELRRRWHPGLSFPEVIALRDEFDAMVHHIRSTRHIRTPVIRCPKCGRVGPAAEPDVSVRSLIITLAKYSITSDEEAKVIEKEWAAYRKANGLDLHGKIMRSVVKQPCPHDSGARG